ncbi:hypothetical protein [Bradyrhizobium sp. Bra78]|uniref:hypothetical protein n=1 Tax=Bradyrhizobium sp. Bra78 TaxID=2926010 RepID=UPI0021C621FF|nr:hypothetical protein [Bradyrhizobium sp. Bra78]
MSKLDLDAYLKETRKLIRRAYRGEAARGKSKISPGEDLRKTVQKYRRKALKVIPSDVLIWLAFLDEAIAFWLITWAFYRTKVDGPSDKRQICLMALAGRVFQDMICVRGLIEGGFFLQSNVVTRTLIEAIDVMHLLNSQQELATEFQQITQNSEASKFWHLHCSKGRIHKLAKARWLWFFDGNEDPAVAFHGLREGYLDMMGMSAHPSFGPSFATFMDRESDSIVENAMGTISPMSKFTIHLILLRVFEYGLLWLGPEAALYKTEGARKKTDMDENITKGLSMMLSIVQSVDRPRQGDPLYPEFKTYWPQPE